MIILSDYIKEQKCVNKQTGQQQTNQRRKRKWGWISPLMCHKNSKSIHGGLGDFQRSKTHRLSRCKVKGNIS